jgi:phage gp46-like protein
VVEAIQWLINTNVVSKFDVIVQWVKSDMLGISITAFPPDGSAPQTFNWAWSGVS